jgi:hypothetical protein
MSHVKTQEWLEDMMNLYVGATTNGDMEMRAHIESILMQRGYEKDALYLREKYKPVDK